MSQNLQILLSGKWLSLYPSGQKINRITTAAVEKFIRKKQEAGTHIGTLRKTIVTLNQIMKYAVRHNYMAHNPLRDAERPKRPQHVDEKEETHADFKIKKPGTNRKQNHQTAGLTWGRP